MLLLFFACIDHATFCIIFAFKLVNLKIYEHSSRYILQYLRSSHNFGIIFHFCSNFWLLRASTTKAFIFAYIHHVISILSCIQHASSIFCVFQPCELDFCVHPSIFFTRSIFVRGLNTRAFYWCALSARALFSRVSTAQSSESELVVLPSLCLYYLLHICITRALFLQLK